MDEPDEKTITVERPTGPRITAAEPQSLGQLVAAKATKTSRSVATTAVMVGATALAFVTKHKFITGIGISTISGVAIHFLVAMSMMGMIGDTTPASVAAYQGPGDVVSGWTFWGSCARVYNAAAASTSTSMCDLVDKTTGAVAVCTLRGTTTGFVDLTAYCPGSLTPAAACAAAAGGACKISKIYDQTGGGHHLTAGTAVNFPDLLFSALNGLPGIDCSTRSGGTCVIQSTSTLALNTPVNFISVGKEASTLAADTGWVGDDGTNALFSGLSSSAANCKLNGFGSGFNVVCSNSSFQVVQGLVNGASSAQRIDATDTGGTAGTGTETVSFRIHRAGSNQDIATIMESGILADGSTSLNSTQRGSLNTNAHSAANGYNF